LNILDQNLKCNKLIPSERVYWDKFPYKLVLDAPSAMPDDVVPCQGRAGLDWFQSIAFMKEMHHLAGHLTGEIRRRYAVDNGKYTMYLTNMDDVNTICDMRDVDAVHGPISQSHVDLLNSEINLSIGKNKFFGAYTHRYLLWFTFKDRTKHGYHRNINDDVRNYIVDQCGPDVVRARTTYYTSTLYVNAEDFDPVIPFLQISYPGLRMRKTQRYICNNL